MKRALFQLFNLLMACVVLVSSTGFGLVEHSCQMRGKKKTMIVAFSDVKPAKGCESGRQPMPSEQVSIKKTTCCQDDQQYENVDVSSSLSQLIAKFVKLVAETVSSGVLAAFVWLLEHTVGLAKSAFQAFSAPPSPSGRDILTLIRSLLL